MVSGPERQWVTIHASFFNPCPFSGAALLYSYFPSQGYEVSFVPLKQQRVGISCCNNCFCYEWEYFALFLFMIIKIDEYGFCNKRVSFSYAYNIFVLSSNSTGVLRRIHMLESRHYNGLIFKYLEDLLCYYYII